MKESNQNVILEFDRLNLSKKNSDPYIIFKHPVFNRKSYVRRIVATSTIL